MNEFTVFVRIITQILWTLLVYLFLRLEFLIWNWSNWYSQYSSSTLSEMFFRGLRFDISAVLTISCVVFVALLIPWPQVTLQLKDLTLRTTLFVLQIPFLLANMIDPEFIHFTGRRMTTDSLFLVREIPGKMGVLLSSYWHLSLFNILILFFFTWIFFFNKKQFNFELNPWKNWISRTVISFLAFIVYVIGVRGGTQLKPLEMTHAGAINDTRLTHLVTNSSFTIIHSIQKERIKTKRDFQALDDYSKYLNKNSSINDLNTNLPWSERPKNIVLFILESFGREYMGLPNQQDGYTPFLDSLIQKGEYFDLSFANGKRSIEALPSILAGVPSLMDEPFLTSQYVTTDIPLLGKLLKEKNIWSGFFHGGQNGTMFFNEFIQRSGFDEYFGANEFPDSSQNDGTWGIWDEAFMLFMANRLDQVQKPLFSVFFSLSSHHPFKVPIEYESQFREGPLPILKTVTYTDASLKKFFQRAQKSSWYKDTLFIFTADHTSKSFRPEYNNPLSGFRVPLLFYYPKKDQAKELDGNEIKAQALTSSEGQTNFHRQIPVQHIDILPTLLQLFGIESKTPLLGKSVFANDDQRQVVLYLDGSYWLLKWPWAVMQTHDDFLFYDFANDPQLKTAIKPDSLIQNDLIFRLKASVQYYNNGLLQNSLIEPDSRL